MASNRTFQVAADKNNQGDLSNKKTDFLLIMDSGR